MFGSLTSGRRSGGGTIPQGRSRLPARLVVGVLAALLLLGTATHIWPAIRAGLHDGTRGQWVATTEKCVHSACTWKGKFVLPSGHVLLTSSQYDGRIPTSAKAGYSVPALYTGSSQVFPASGSDLWISLLVALVVAVLGLYWASHRFVADFMRRRQNDNVLDSSPITAPRH